LPASTSLAQAASLWKTRWHVEQGYQQLKEELGLVLLRGRVIAIEGSGVVRMERSARGRGIARHKVGLDPLRINMDAALGSDRAASGEA